MRNEKQKGIEIIDINGRKSFILRIKTAVQVGKFISGLLHNHFEVLSNINGKKNMLEGMIEGGGFLNGLQRLVCEVKEITVKILEFV